MVKGGSREGMLCPGLLKLLSVQPLSRRNCTPFIFGLEEDTQGMSAMVSPFQKQKLSTKREGRNKEGIGQCFNKTFLMLDAACESFNSEGPFLLKNFFSLPCRRIIQHNCNNLENFMLLMSLFPVSTITKSNRILQIGRCPSAWNPIYCIYSLPKLSLQLLPKQRVFSYHRSTY